MAVQTPGMAAEIPSGAAWLRLDSLAQVPLGTDWQASMRPWSLPLSPLHDAQHSSSYRPGDRGTHPDGPLDSVSESPA